MEKDKIIPEIGQYYIIRPLTTQYKDRKTIIKWKEGDWQAVQRSQYNRKSERIMYDRWEFQNTEIKVIRIATESEIRQFKLI